MRVLFRADSSSKIGTGHIRRSLVLASRLDEREIFFATKSLEGDINNIIPYPVFTLETSSIDELIKLIKELNIDKLIIDHYEIGFDDEKKIKEALPNLRVLVFDDLYEKHYCDVLLNHNIYAKKSAYEGLVPEHCELRCGVLYTLIRSEFRDEKKRKREKIYDVFIAIGGADIKNITPKIIENLPKKLKICVATTSSNPNIAKLQKLERENLNLKIDDKKIEKLLNESKFAIISPSGLVHEALFMEVPFLAIKVAKNQRLMYEYLIENEYMAMKEWDEELFLDFRKKIWKDL